MKLLGMTAVAILATCFGENVIAGDANPVEMASQIGFIGCDSLIAETFEHAMKSTERRFSVNYFEETARNSVDLSVTFGSPGDTVWQTAHFEKSGGNCYSAVRIMFSEVGNCAGILNKDEYFKYETDSAGALWTKNKGGVTKLFVQSGNVCTQIFIRSDKMKATK